MLEFYSPHAAGASSENRDVPLLRLWIIGSGAGKRGLSVQLHHREVNVREQRGVIDTAPYAPYVLSILRIIVALLFFEHGLSKLFGWPSASSHPEFLTLGWFSGAIEFFGGALLTAGLLSRLSAFIMSGEMAFAYFISHAPQGFFPILNRGEGAILYCFIFFYIAFAGPGPWSLDALLRHRRSRQSM